MLHHPGLIQAAFLGVVEGLTEFIPVSSTGHLILLVDLLGFRDNTGKTFEIVIQLGAILAVLLVYWRRFWDVATGLFKGSKNAFHFCYVVLIAFLPAMVLGGLLHDFIKEQLFKPSVVAVSLILGGIAILAIERKAKEIRYHTLEHMPYKTALKIGFYQCLAMIPGVSRSGATIMGAMLMGVDRKVAAEFSFFLAIPTMFAATVYDLYKNKGELSTSGMEQIAVGFVVAFVVAAFVVKSLVGFVSKHGFAPFAWYRIAVGSVMLAIMLLSA